MNQNNATAAAPAGQPLNFECDYNNGAHPEVLRRLVETNDETSLTYGFDEWSDRAKERIRAACQCPQADVFFLVGGTQTNATVIDGILRSYEGVVCAETATSTSMNRVPSSRAVTRSSPCPAISAK